MTLFYQLCVVLFTLCKCEEIWDIVTVSVIGPSTGNPFKEIEITATFKSPKKINTTVNGFYNGNGSYIIRFMPNEIGSWSYYTSSNNPYVEDKIGYFKVTNATGYNYIYY